LQNIIFAEVVRMSSFQAAKLIEVSGSTAKPFGLVEEYGKFKDLPALVIKTSKIKLYFTHLVGIDHFNCRPVLFCLHIVFVQCIQ